MAKVKRLSQKQYDVIEDMFNGLDEEEIIKKHGVSRTRYRKWIRSERFNREMQLRMRSSKLRSELILSRYAQVAAMKLVQLTDSQKEETARKACLDIISLPLEEHTEPDAERAKLVEGLSGQMASRLLRALAGGDGAKLDKG